MSYRRMFQALMGVLGLAVMSFAVPAAADVVAKIGTKTITLEEVDNQVRATNMKLFNELYDARRQAIEDLVSDHLLDKEAKTRGVSRDQLVKTEIDQKVVAVSDADVEKWFNDNQQRLGGRPLEQVKPQISGMLSQQRQAERHEAFVGKLREAAEVSVMLDPPRVKVALDTDDPAKGPANAPVQIVEFTDFECPFCSRVNPALAKIRETYGDSVQIVFRDFPLPMHRNAPKAHEAANCAKEQGKFWEYHDKLFTNNKALAAENLKQYAKDLSLDAAKFDQCLDSSKFQKEVEADVKAGQDSGVSGTPAFFINGRFVSGALPFESFAEIIDEELKLKGVANPKNKG